jgi:hypothetical protein
MSDRFIGNKWNHKLYLIKDKREWDDVEAAQIPEAILDVIVENQNQMLETQAYLDAVYIPLKQTGAADVSNVEVPQCLLDQVSSSTSGAGSKKRKSSSSTKKKASSSGSKSQGATSA